MLLDISDAAELPHKLQGVTISATTPSNQVHDGRLSEMPHARSLLAKTPAQIGVFEIHKE